MWCCYARREEGKQLRTVSSETVLLIRVGFFVLPISNLKELYHGDWLRRRLHIRVWVLKVSATQTAGRVFEVCFSRVGYYYSLNLSCTIVISSLLINKRIYTLHGRRGKGGPNHVKSSVPIVLDNLFCCLFWVLCTNNANKWYQSFDWRPVNCGRSEYSAMTEDRKVKIAKFNGTDFAFWKM